MKKLKFVATKFVLKGLEDLKIITELGRKDTSIKGLKDNQQDMKNIGNQKRIKREGEIKAKMKMER